MRGQAGVLPRFANGERQLVVVDDCRHRCFVPVDHHTLDRGGTERTGQEDGFVVAPGDDVDPLVAQFPHHRLDPGTFHPDAGANRIDTGVVRIDRDLRPFSRFTSNRLNFDDTLIDFRDFELEKLDQKLRVGPGQDHLRPLGCAKNVYQIGADGISLTVALFSNLLLEGDNSLRAAKVNQNIAMADLLDGAADDFSESILVILVDLLPFGFPNSLDQDLFGGLNGIPTEIGKPEQLLDFAIDFDVGFDLAGSRKSDLQGRIIDFVVIDDGFGGEDLDIAGIEVDVHLDVVRRAEPPLGCGEQPNFQGFDHHRLVNVLFLSNLAQRLQDFIVQKDISSKFEMEVGFSDFGGRNAPGFTIYRQFKLRPVVSRQLANQYPPAFKYYLNGPTESPFVVAIGLEGPVQPGRGDLEDVSPVNWIVGIQDIRDPAAEARAITYGDSVDTIHVDAQHSVPGTTGELQVNQIRALILQIELNQLFDGFLQHRIVHKPGTRIEVQIFKRAGTRPLSLFRRLNIWYFTL